MQLSINKNDCLTCAFVNALDLSYKCIYNSFRIIGNNTRNLDKNLMGMKGISVFRALFSKKPMVVIYAHNDGTNGGHAVAIRDGFCIDNCIGSKNQGKSLYHLWRKHDVIRIWRK